MRAPTAALPVAWGVMNDVSGCAGVRRGRVPHFPEGTRDPHYCPHSSSAPWEFEFLALSSRLSSPASVVHLVSQTLMVVALLSLFTLLEKHWENPWLPEIFYYFYFSQFMSILCGEMCWLQALCGRLSASLIRV